MLSLTPCNQIAKAEQQLSSKRSIAFFKAVAEVRFAENAIKKIKAIKKIEADPKLLQAEVNKGLLMHVPCTYFVVASIVMHGTYNICSSEKHLQAHIWPFLYFSPYPSRDAWCPHRPPMSSFQFSPVCWFTAR